MSGELHPLVEESLELRQELPKLNELGPEGAREQLGAITADPGEPAVGEVTDETIPGPAGAVPVRAYRPEGEPPFPTLAYFHGGGWVVGDLDTHDRTCRTLTNAADCLVVSVDYRLAPENPFPAAVEDAYAAAEWLAENADEFGGDPGRLAVAGDSAGANLAAVVSLMARDFGGPGIDHQVLVYPVVDDEVYESSRENAEGFGLDGEVGEWFDECYVASEVHRGNPYLYPMKARDHSGLPRATVLTAEFDPLRDEGIAYAERLAEAGVRVTQRNYEGMIHGFFSMLQEPFDLDAAHDAMDLVADDLAESFDA